MELSDIILPVELTGYVRAAQADYERNQFTLSRYLPSEPLNDLDFRFVRGGEGLAETATFRSYDTEAPVAHRPGVSRVSGELPPISQKIRLGEYARLRQRALDTEIRSAIFSDAERVTRAISARMEKARGDALVNGALTLSENGVTATVDFGRSSSMVVAPTPTWDHRDSTSGKSDGDPINDLLTWQEAYVAHNASDIGVILTSRKVLAALMRNDFVRAAAFPSAANAPSVVTPVVVNQVLNAFGLPSIELYDAQVSVNGTATRVIDDAKVLLMPAAGTTDFAQVGKVFWGRTAESDEPGYGLGGDEPGIVAGVYTSNDPVGMWTLASAIALPVLANPDLVMVADVLS